MKKIHFSKALDKSNEKQNFISKEDKLINNNNKQIKRKIIFKK